MRGLFSHLLMPHMKSSDSWLKYRLLSMLHTWPALGMMAGEVGHLAVPYLDASSCTVYHHDPVVELIVYDGLVV